MPLEGLAALPPWWWCFLGELCFWGVFFTHDSSAVLIVSTIRGVTKWATLACTIPWYMHGKLTRGWKADNCQVACWWPNDKSCPQGQDTQVCQVHHGHLWRQPLWECRQGPRLPGNDLWLCIRRRSVNQHVQVSIKCNSWLSWGGHGSACYTSYRSSLQGERWW